MSERLLIALAIVAGIALAGLAGAMAERAPGRRGHDRADGRCLAAVSRA